MCHAERKFQRQIWRNHGCKKSLDNSDSDVSDLSSSWLFYGGYDNMCCVKCSVPISCDIFT